MNPSGGQARRPVQPQDRRRVWPLVVLAVALLAVIGVDIGRDVYAHRYQPLGPGSGPYGSFTPDTLKTLTDGIGDTHLILVGGIGTRGVVDHPVINLGKHQVTILGLDRSDAAREESRLGWASLMDRRGRPGGLPRDERPLPATIDPGHEIILQLDVVKPACAKGSTEILDDIPVRWSALGARRVARVDDPAGQRRGTADRRLLPAGGVEARRTLLKLCVS
jgi:hypothetical protein